jgi:hypothetical protein
VEATARRYGSQAMVEMIQNSPGRNYNLMM